MNRPSGLFRAFIPENLGRRYHRLNESNFQDILNLMRREEVEVFVIVKAEVISSTNGKKLERQIRRWVKLTTNSNGQLCYIEPPNSVRVVDRDSKPLFLTERVLEEIGKMRQKDDLISLQLEQIRRPSNGRVWAEIMDGVGRRENYDLEAPGEDCLQVSFVLVNTGKSNAEAIDLYIKAITEEIAAAEKKAKDPLERILCNGLVKNNDFVIKGLRIKLKKLGYKVQTADLPEDHSGRDSYRRMMVWKKLNSHYRY